MCTKVQILSLFHVVCKNSLRVCALLTAQPWTRIYFPNAFYPRYPVPVIVLYGYNFETTGGGA